MEYFTPVTTPLSNLVQVLQHCVSQTSYVQDSFAIKSSPQKHVGKSHELQETGHPSTSTKISDPTKSTSHPSASLLPLLRKIHLLVTNYADLLPTKLQLHIGAQSLPLLPSSDFVNEKISARLKCRVEESSIKSVDRFTKCYPFLLDLETKIFIFYYEKLSKQKQTVTVSRQSILSEAKRVMFDVKRWRPTMDIRYEEEEGFGQGPSLEFYTLVSQEMKGLKNIWRQRDGELVEGLFPKPIGSGAPDETELKEWFKFLGMFVGKAVYDRRRVCHILSFFNSMKIDGVQVH